jgi:hypothetical protein|tara:strand:+ start:196 stop:432 length:237 start_codon:yes stop_codon:yes gene_type:complete
MNITKLVNLLEQVEDSINKEDLEKATDIIGYLIDDIIEFEMAHEDDFRQIHEMLKKVHKNDHELYRAQRASGDIVGEA